MYMTTMISVHRILCDMFSSIISYSKDDNPQMVHELIALHNFSLATTCHFQRTFLLNESSYAEKFLAPRNFPPDD